MGIAQTFVRDLQRNKVDGLLKEIGFSKEKRNYYRDSGKGLDVVSIDISPFSQPGEGEYRFYFGKHFHGLEDFYPEEMRVRAPKLASECAISTPMGFLLSPPRDDYWKIDDTCLVEEHAKRVDGLITEKYLPWLREVESAESALETLLRQKHARLFVRSALCLLVGRKKMAEDLLSQEYREVGNAGAAARQLMIAFARRNQLHLNMQ